MGNKGRTNIFHVKKTGQYWTISLDRSGKILSKHYKKKRAVSKGRKVANGYSPSKLKIHKVDGSVQDTVSYDGYKPTPSEINQSRSDRAVSQDRGKSARTAKSYLDWVMNPGGSDIPTVDDGQKGEKYIVVCEGVNNQWSWASDTFSDRERAEKELKRVKEGVGRRCELWTEREWRKFKSGRLSNLEGVKIRDEKSGKSAGSLADLEKIKIEREKKRKRRALDERDEKVKSAILDLEGETGAELGDISERTGFSESEVEDRIGNLLGSDQVYEPIAGRFKVLG